MPPKKKLKNAEAEHVAEEKETQCLKSEFSITNTENISTRLSLLPSDVLLYICKFLSPADLVSLSQLGDPKFREVADFQRILNFSVCRRGGSELLSSYFSRENVKRIQSLNFNAYVFAKPCDLVLIICRCKNLVNLSVIECGIQVKHMTKILKSCSTLKELSWSTKESLDVKSDFSSSVTKLFLLCPTKYIMSSLGIFKIFPQIERAVIYLSDSLTVPPLNTSWSCSRSFSSYDNLIWITFINDSCAEQCLSIRSVMLITHNKKHLIKLPSMPLKDITSHVTVGYRHSPFLKVRCQEQDITFLSSCSSRTYTHVIICLTATSFDIYESLFKCVLKVTGSELKHLTIDWEDPKSSINIPNMQPQFYQIIANLFGTLLLDCKNITVLNFGKLHFMSDSPFKAICCLKNLKFLSMPTCAFPKNLPNSTELELPIQQQSSFEELTSECCKVEEFHLVCCYLDKGKMQDTELFPIQNWKRLISFTVYSVIFSSCRFLRKIADCCPEFQFFSYINSAENSGCIFYEDVIYLLTNAKNLIFIRINCKNFNPQFERFSHALSLAKNLEGICFVTRIQTAIKASSFVTSINQLKYLHLFHFDAPKVPESLYAQVKKSMDSNNVKYGKIESRCLDSIHYHADNDWEDQRDTPRTAFFHARPSFVCCHMHLKKCLFDSCSYLNKM